MELTQSDIQFNHHIHSKSEALRAVSAALELAGLARSDYLAGLEAREQQISTFLGNGIAIPHGTPQSRDAVLKTGVSVLVCPQGVDWGEGQTARLIVGIAAQDNEHLDILRQLTHALGDDNVPAALARATTPREVLDVLAGNYTVEETNNDEQLTFDEEATFTLRNPHGLHARPGAILVKTVKQWSAEVFVENLDTRSPVVDARNLMRVVSLGAKQGHRLRFRVKGKEARAALHAIGEAFEGGLGEMAAHPQHLDKEPVRTKRGWLSRLFG
ncbi:HPr family phosphocarrier protein [Lelliottia nimipressuralis]|uniref:HPr family phosphocarrier protein n=1 Tax=Lelliottia nimipressuralis TaxID=69220 RepID=UPI00289D261B|nr:HPr family phosphocarrier protein [Lelliottia nimipressuralis]